MKRYIDADKAILDIEIIKADGKTEIPISGIETYLHQKAITEQNLLIVSETCPVIRCRDCDFNDTDHCIYMDSAYFRENGFCSNAKPNIT